MKGVRALRLHFKRTLMAIQILVWILVPFSVFNADITEVSAVPLSPYIAVLPEQTINSTITVGMNYTISINTDYAGTDIWAWQFDLTFNPYVLHGGVNTTDIWTQTSLTKRTWYATKRPVIEGSEKVYMNQALMTKDVDYTIDYPTGKITFTTAPPMGAEIKAIYVGDGVVNGDLITTIKNPSANVLFFPGQFDNTAGTLSLTGAGYERNPPDAPRPATYGPGVLAYVSFMVVGTGYSNIALGNATQLLQGGLTEPPPKIIDAATMPDHIGHGYFNNIPPIHDVAVIDVSAPSTAILGDLVPISVRVANEGNFTQNFNVTVYANTTIIGTETDISLASGEVMPFIFNWDTSTTLKGNYTYTINATVWPLDDKPGNNFKPTSIIIRTAHDAAVIGLETPAQGTAGNIIFINVTVTNEGSFEEDVTLTLSYQILYSPTPPTPFNSTNLKLAELRTPLTLSVPWNTASLAPDTYKINATATIDQDEHPPDNSETAIILLNPAQVHDVAVTKLSADSSVVQGETVTINVTVKNKGTFVETFNIAVSYDSTPIGMQTASSLAIGMNTTLIFEWNTTNIVPGVYAVIAEAVLAGDAQTGDNQGIAAVAIETPPPPPPGHIAGTVRDSSTENPIEGANVTANGYFDVTDSDGHFNITNVPPATYRVTASANGYQVSSRININVASGQTTVLDFSLTSLPTTGHIAGTVRDSSTENPIEGANVTANGHSVLTGANGSYSIELQPGTYIVKVSAQGYETSSRTDIVVEAGESTTMNFELGLVQSPNILPYIGLAIIVAIIVLGVAIYLTRTRGRKKVA